MVCCTSSSDAPNSVNGGDGTQKPSLLTPYSSFKAMPRRKKSWCCVITASLIALALGLGLGLGIKLYFFSSDAVIANTRITGYSASEFTTTEQYKFRNGTAVLLGVAIDDVGVSSVVDAGSATARRLLRRRLRSLLTQHRTLLSTTSRIDVTFTIAVDNYFDKRDMHTALKLLSATQFTQALQAAGLAAVATAPDTLTNLPSASNVTEVEVSSLSVSEKAALEAAFATERVSLISSSDEASPTNTSARTRAIAAKRLERRGLALDESGNVDVMAWDKNVDYNLYETDTYVDDQTSSLFEFANTVMCYVKQISWFKEANLGPFQATFDSSECEDNGNGAKSGESSASGSDAPEFYTWTINSTMPTAENGLDEYRVDVWVTIPGETDAYFDLTYYMAKEDVIKKSNETIVENNLVGKDQFVIMKRTIKLKSRNDDSLKALILLSADETATLKNLGFAYAIKENDEGYEFEESIRAYRVENKTAGTSYAEYEAPGFLLGVYDDSSDTTYRGNSATKNGVVKTKWLNNTVCQSASLRYFITDSYALFDENGAEVRLQTWFSLHAQGSDNETYQGWMSYPGYFSSNEWDRETGERFDDEHLAIAQAAFTTGSTVYVTDWDGDYQDDIAYTINVAPGVLTRRSSSVVQMSSIANKKLTLYMSSKTCREGYSYEFYGTTYCSWYDNYEIDIMYNSSLSATMVVRNTSMTTGHAAYSFDYDSSVSDYERENGLIFYSSVVGSAGYGFVMSATTVKIMSSEALYPGALTSDLNLLCMSNCVDPNWSYSAGTPYNWGDADFATPNYYPENKRTDYKTYTIGSDGVLKFNGTDVTYSAAAYSDESASYWGLYMYDLFEGTTENFAALNCPLTSDSCGGVDKLSAYYEWSSSPWNRMAYLVDSEGNKVFTSGPLQLKTTLPTAAGELRPSPSGADYTGLSLELTSHGGWMQGLPMACYNYKTGETTEATYEEYSDGTRWPICDWNNNEYYRSDVVLPDGHTLELASNSSIKYVVKPSYLAEVAVFLDDAACEGIEYVTGLPLPDLSIEFGTLDIGEEPKGAGVRKQVTASN